MTKKPVHSHSAPGSQPFKRVYAPEAESRAPEAELERAREHFLWIVLKEEIVTYFSKMLEKDRKTLDTIVVLYSIHSARSYSSKGKERFKGLLSAIRSIVSDDIYQGFSEYISLKIDFYTDIVLSLGVSGDEDLLRKALRLQFGISSGQIDSVAHRIENLVSSAKEAGEIGLVASPESFLPTEAEAKSSRFAHIERYEDRQPGEDAIAFYARTWAREPTPFYRDDIEAHDPDLIPAISQRCRNLNRSLSEGAPRHRLEDIIPPAAPQTGKLAERREKERLRKARQRQRAPI